MNSCILNLALRSSFAGYCDFIYKSEGYLLATSSFGGFHSEGMSISTTHVHLSEWDAGPCNSISYRREVNALRRGPVREVTPRSGSLLSLAALRSLALTNHLSTSAACREWDSERSTRENEKKKNKRKYNRMCVRDHVYVWWMERERKKKITWAWKNRRMSLCHVGWRALGYCFLLLSAVT